MANAYSDWQSLDLWDTSMPEEYSGEPIQDSWDLNQDNEVDVVDLLHGVNKQGFTQTQADDFSMMVTGDMTQEAYEELYGAGPQYSDLNLSLQDLNSMASIYRSAMTEKPGEALPIDFYENTQFANAEKALRKTYEEDYKTFSNSISAQAYNARRDLKKRNRTLGRSTISSGKTERRAKMNREAYANNVERLRLDMENKRAIASQDIFTQRKGYEDSLLSLYSAYLGVSPDDVTFSLTDAYECMENGGEYGVDGTCTKPEAAPASGDIHAY